MTKLYHNNRLVLSIEKTGFKGQKFNSAFEKYLNELKLKSSKSKVHTFRTVMPNS